MLIGWATTAQGQTSASDQPSFSPAMSIDCTGIKCDRADNCVVENVWKLVSPMKRYYMHTHSENDVLRVI